MKGLVWFRRDLRLAGNPALAAALRECHEVIPLFVFDGPLIRSRRFGALCVNFMLGCLDDLSRRLASHGLTLRWRRGDPVEEVVKAAREIQADRVYWNRDYEPAAIERDRRVREELTRYGVTTHTYKDHVVFEPDEVLSRSGTPFQRFGAYRRQWWARWQQVQAAMPPVVQPKLGGRLIEPPRQLPSAGDLDYPATPFGYRAGETAARQAIRRFLDGPIRGYAAARNRPGLDATSQLSPHFRFGTLSTELAVRSALAAHARHGAAWKTGVIGWIDELVWRDFFQHILWHFPRVVTEPFRPPRFSAVEDDARLFQAWCNGRTGFPLIDAGMRQLNETGWMHNRVRMVVASFLVKDLHLDWRWGEEYFMCHLIDADVAANNGNWQWCASTGTDAMPGYRIFNPTLQSKKFDPDGVYIRRFVPELRRMPARLIHQPQHMTMDDQNRFACRIGPDYPAEIVDHRAASRHYLQQTP